MPLYDLQCKECKHVNVDVFQKIDAPNTPCPVCTGETERILTASAPVHIFPEGFWEHVGPKPVYFKSKRELRNYCRENGKTSEYAES